MFDIAATVILFNLMVVAFKFFDRFKVDNQHAIFVNYLTAAVVAVAINELPISPSEILHSDWIFHAVCVGLGFIFLFNLFALGTQRVGFTVTTIANKMSLIIPVGVALIYYNNDVFSWTKLIGIVIALIGIYFSTTKNGKISFDKKYLWLILTIFFGQGIIDMIFNHAQRTAVSDSTMMLFFITLFSVSGIAGGLYALPPLVKGNKSFKWQDLLFGIAIGVPNYGTLHYFFKALESGAFPPSAVYPLVSMGVVICSALIGWIFFKEKLSKTNWVGIFAAVLAISIIAFVG